MKTWQRCPESNPLDADAATGEVKMPRSFQHVSVVRPDFGKSFHPGSNEVSSVRGPDENRIAQVPQSLVHRPQQRLGNRDQIPSTPLDMGTKCRSQIEHLFAGQLLLTVAAVNRKVTSGTHRAEE